MPALMGGHASHQWTSDGGQNPSVNSPIPHFLQLLSSILVWIFVSLIIAEPTWAATLQGGPLGQRELRGDQNKVTVTVLDLIDPTAPILISPEDNTFITTQRPTFVWKGSKDNNPMSHYSLWLDGELYIDLISLVSYENTEYKLVYDKNTHQYSLTVKKPISEGAHTWKIVAYDQSRNSNTSATWSFIIDTLAPYFIINKIGRLPVTISAYDYTTIPSAPIELLENEPLLTGTGEPNSIVTLTLTIPGQEGRTYRTVIDENGYWSIQLGLLPRGTVVDLSFVIEDKAGLITVMNGVQILIKSLFVAGGIGGPTPTPAQQGAGPRPPDYTYILGDFWPIADWRPEFEKRMAPIKEIVYSLLTRSLVYLPDSIAEKLAHLPTQITGSVAPILAWQNVLISLSLPLAALAVIGMRFGAELSLHTLLQILNALNLWPASTALIPGKKGGWLFDTKTGQGIAFAKISLYSLELDRKVDEVVSDMRGYFPAFVYLAKKRKETTYQHYRIKVEKNEQTLEFGVANKYWPLKTFDSYSYFHNLYQGGLISHNHQKPAPFWLIPSYDTKTTVSNTLVEVVSYLNGLPFWVLGWELVICFLVLVFYTSLPNAAIVLYYIALAGSRIIRKLLPNNLSIRLIDDQKRPVAGVKVFCRPIFDPTTLWVRETDQKGFARFALTTPSLLRHNQKDQDYVLRVHKHNQALTAQGAVVESVKITVGKSPSAEQFQLTSTPITTAVCEL